MYTFRMNIPEILTDIDTEIARLQHIRSLLSGTPSTPATTVTRAPGRPKGVRMSSEARSKMAEAQKKRWAKLKKA